jgi:hypothetical protein
VLLLIILLDLVIAGGGSSPGVSNVIDFFNIPTGGNATDFGDLSEMQH